MSQYGVDYLQRLRAAVEKFEEAFDAWMSTQVESDHMSARGLFPTVWTKEGQDQSEVQRLELGVAEAAGLAASAVSVTGAYIGIAGLGAIDPISNWSFMSAPKAPIAPRDIRTTTANVKGRLDAMIVDVYLPIVDGAHVIATPAASGPAMPPSWYMTRKATLAAARSRGPTSSPMIARELV